MVITTEQLDQAQKQNVTRDVAYLMMFNLSFDQAFEKALADRELKRQFWLKEVIDPLAEKHGTTREVMISMLFFDGTADEPKTKDAYWDGASDLAALTYMAAGLKPEVLGKAQGASGLNLSEEPLSQPPQDVIVAYEKCAQLLEMDTQSLLLMAGDMSRDELLTVKAVLAAMARKIRKEIPAEITQDYVESTPTL